MYNYKNIYSKTPLKFQRKTCGQLTRGIPNVSIANNKTIAEGNL